MSAPQHVYDALKRMREEGEAWVTWKGERLHLRPFVPGEDDEWRPVDTSRPPGILSDGFSVGDKRYWFPAYHAIVKARVPGGIALAHIWWHEDRLHLKGLEGERVPFRRANDDVVLAIITERHPRRKEPST